MKGLLNKCISEIDIGKLKDRLVKLEGMARKIQEIDNSIVDILIDSKAKESDLNSEIESAEKYSDEFILMEQRINECINKSVHQNFNSNEMESSRYNPKLKQCKLPEIDIKPFDGQLIVYHSGHNLRKYIKTVNQKIVTDSNIYCSRCSPGLVAENFQKVIH